MKKPIPPSTRYRTRLDIVAAKGSEELLPEEAYAACLPNGIWIEDKGNHIIIKAYTGDVKTLSAILKKTGIRIYGMSTTREEGQDYAALTKKYFRPIRIEDITILSPWNKKRGKQQSIVIEPGMAFGTGRHESTKIMIKLIKDADISGKEVLDLGCGSAILSFYASLRGAQKVTAVDNDEDAIRSAKKNTLLNDITNIRFACTGLENIKGKYDIVLANLDIRTFANHAQHIVKLLSRDGTLIISGILGKDTKHALSLFQPLQPVRTERKNSWRGFVFKKTG